MPRRRFYVPRDQIRNGVAILPPDQSHHLFNVLRLGPGDEVEVFDGEGTSYVGEVSNAGPEIRIHKAIPAAEVNSARCRIILAPALIKAERFEWMLQKATELGVEEFAPLITRHSEISIPADRLATRMERWRRIVREASKQCCRLSLPSIRQPERFEDFLNSGCGGDYPKLMLYEKAPISWGLQVPPSNQVYLCIGPEGGWDREEVADAEQAGYHVFSLGDRILRSETAAIASVSIVQFLVGRRGEECFSPAPQLPEQGHD
jgi:16S rRNA (uracil1498-N3)-methyltransferase